MTSDGLQVLAAGSLRHAFPALLQAFGEQGAEQGSDEQGGARPH